MRKHSGGGGLDRDIKDSMDIRVQISCLLFTILLQAQNHLF